MTRQRSGWQRACTRPAGCACRWAAPCSALVLRWRPPRCCCGALRRASARGPRSARPAVRASLHAGRRPLLVRVGAGRQRRRTLPRPLREPGHVLAAGRVVASALLVGAARRSGARRRAGAAPARLWRWPWRRGLAGLGFHVYNLLRKPGRHLLAEPVLCAHRSARRRRSASAVRWAWPPIASRARGTTRRRASPACPAGRALCALVAAGLAGTVGEVGAAAFPRQLPEPVHVAAGQRCRRWPPLLTAGSAIERRARARPRLTRAWLRLTARARRGRRRLPRLRRRARDGRLAQLDAERAGRPAAAGAAQLLGAGAGRPGGPAPAGARRCLRRASARPTPATTCCSKWDSPSFDDATRAVLQRRLHAVPPRRFFTEAEFALLACACARLLPQPRSARRRSRPGSTTTCSHGPRRRLPRTRHAAVRAGLAARPGRRSTRRRGAGMAAASSTLDGAQQDATLRAVQRGEAQAIRLRRAASRRSSSRTCCSRPRPRTSTRSPQAWSEIGFGGPASPRGYVRLGFDQRDPWEAPLPKRRDGDAAMTQSAGDPTRRQRPRARRLRARRLDADARVRRSTSRSTSPSSAPARAARRSPADWPSKGFSVVCFDAGPFWRPLEDFASDETEQQKLYWTDDRITRRRRPDRAGRQQLGPRRRRLHGPLLA